LSAAAENFLCYDRRVATRTLKYTEWLKLVKRHALDDEFANVSGFPVADTASRLNVTKQRVHQMLESGVLDALALTTKAGNVAITLVTEASIDRYLAKRVPVPGHQGYFTFPETA
jgi:hypothetical protein